MKIYTKGGDKGETSLLSGNRVPKYHDRIEAYGTTDELNSYLGMLRSFDVGQGQAKVLEQVQNLLFSIGSSLALDQERPGITIPQVKEMHVKQLEVQIDKMDAELPPMKYFVLPGGNMAVSVCHVCRCIARKVERLVVKLAETEPVDEMVVKYMNRLSDYLFVLARKMAHDQKVTETPWIPEKQ